jgi:hypothetical protein
LRESGNSSHAIAVPAWVAEAVCAARRRLVA